MPVPRFSSGDLRHHARPGHAPMHKRGSMPQSELNSLPRGMRALAWSGALPFLGAVAVAVAWPSWRGMAMAGFIAYGAVILSFLGGARWGRGFGAQTSFLRYAEAVTPSLVAFAGLLMIQQPVRALGLLAAGFTIWLVLDLRDPLWPAAYKRMRLRISLLVLALHAVWLAL